MLRLLLLGLLFLLPLSALSKTFADLPESGVEEKYVTTEDGVTEKLIHLSNPGKPILLAEPGMGAQGISLEIPASALRMQGDHDVFIGNWRGSAKLPEGSTYLSNGRNGLFEVIRKDFPAHLRYILNEYATPQQKAMGISLLGHSMGGMMIAGALSDPKLRAEFRPFIRAIVLLQSPHHMKYLQAKMRLFARVGIPTIEALQAMGVDSIEMHSKLLHHSKQIKSAGGISGRILMPTVENFAIALTKVVLNPRFTGREAFRRAFFKMSAYSIPLDLIQDFANATVNGGELNDADGNPLIIPESLEGIPVQMIRARPDTLAPWEEQREYFERLGTSQKQLVDIEKISHVGSLLITEEKADYFSHVLGFLKNPAEAIRTAPVIPFHPYCETLLTRAINYFKR